MRQPARSLSTASVETVTHGAQATLALGRLVGCRLLPGQVVALCGELGSGKTTLAQGIAAGLGVTDAVTSPTFTLVNEYSAAGGRRLIHMDTYRLGGHGEAHTLAEAATIGVAELLEEADAVIVIEWADQLQSLLPPDRIDICLTHVAGHPYARRLNLLGHGPHGYRLVRALTTHLHPDLLEESAEPATPATQG